ncbi:MAG TPA: hypothetical protein DD979_12315 [Gammaproteobacteria bacterium]|jgi:Mg-chelatase subunit ChlD|nr:hypothetical protein [Gammaproteobacteria bacterium]
MHKLTNDNSRLTLLAALSLALVSLVGCGDGLDRRNNSNDDSGGGGSISFNDDGPADASYVRLERLDYRSEKPSVISVLLQAKDRDNTPVDSLTAADFDIRENGDPLPQSESASTLIERKFLPFHLDTVVLMDISSSISNTDLANMKQAVTELVRDSATGQSRLFAGQRVALYTFDDSLTAVKTLSSSPAHIVAALDAIHLPIAITPTDLYGALRSAATLWETSQTLAEIHDGAVVLITDGTDTAGRSSLSSTLDALGDKKVFTIGVGEDANEDVLSKLGTANSYTVNSFDELGPALADIREKLRRYADSLYVLQYASPKRAAEGDADNSDHKFEIYVHGNKNSGNSGRVSGNFNSYEFSNVAPRVIIGGPDQLETGQTESYLADTFWAYNDPLYSWEISGSCELVSNEGPKVVISATASGSCQLSVTDTGHNAVSAAKAVSVRQD